MSAELSSPQRADRKGIFGWMMFDWAAQPFHTLILTFIFAPYFTSNVASTGVEGQAYWGYTAAIGGILIAVLSPILGAIADATGPRKPWILFFTIFAAAGTLLLWWAEPDGSNLSIYIALIGFVLGLLGFEFAAVFNNAMMPTLVAREELGRLSGNAWGLGYVAGLLTLVIVLLLLATNDKGLTLIGIEPIFGLDAASKQGERSTGPLTAIWLIIFILPLFMFTPDVRTKVRTKGAISKGLSELADTLKGLPQSPSLFAYLGSSMLYRDALNGLYTFGGIYAAGVLGWSIVQIAIFGIIANITGVMGAMLGGRMDDRFGPKSVVTTCVILLMICSLTVISTDKGQVFFMDLAMGIDSGIPDIIFYVCGGIIGAAGGALQAASRTLMVDQADPDRMTEAFGLYALSGKATSFLAPAAIAIVTDISSSQRIGVLPIVGLFLLSLFLLPLVKQRVFKTPSNA